MAAQRAAWLFVVKLWAERRASADAPPVWRGRVDDVRGGTRRYFTSLAQLREYLRDRLEETPPNQEGVDRAPTKPPRVRPRRKGPTMPEALSPDLSPKSGGEERLRRDSGYTEPA